MKESHHLNSTVDLAGVVLAGGKSRRMGVDKSQINYKGEPHELYTARLLKPYCSEVCISKSPSEVTEIAGFRVVHDLADDRGPLHAIHSAFCCIPEKSLLIMACDLPFINEETIALLVQSRSKDHDVTCLRHHDKAYPEPLMAIYERHISVRLANALDKKVMSPTRLLEECKVKYVNIQDTKVLFNANEQVQKDKARNIIRNKAR